MPFQKYELSHIQDFIKCWLSHFKSRTSRCTLLRGGKQSESVVNEELRLKNRKWRERDAITKKVDSPMVTRNSAHYKVRLDDIIVVTCRRH